MAVEESFGHELANRKKRWGGWGFRVIAGRLSLLAIEENQPPVV
jgi:hypothetical protein